jgi:hypothetical protein
VAAVRSARESVQDSGAEPTVTDTEAEADELEGPLRGFGSLEESRTWVPGRFAARAGRGCRREREAVVTV